MQLKNTKCEKHQKAKEYLCISKSNQQQILFLCQECKNQESTQIHKVINFSDILNKTQEAQVRCNDQDSKLQNLRNKFEECKNRIENKIEQNYNHFFDLEQNLKQLQHSSDQYAFTQLLQNPSFQYLFQDEKKSETQNNFSQKLQNEFQQFTEEMNTFIDNYQNYYDYTPQTQNSKQNNNSQGSNLNQGNQQTKQGIKINKIVAKKNEVCKNQNNNQFYEQLHPQTESENERLIAIINEIELEKENEQNKNHNNLQPDVQPQMAQSQKKLNPNKITNYIQNNSSKKMQTEQNEPEVQQNSLEKYELQTKDSIKGFFQGEKIKKIMVVDKDLMIVASKTVVKLCKKLENKEERQSQLLQLDQPFVDIHLIDFKEILIHFKNKLQLYDLSLNQITEKEIRLNKNKFAYKKGIIYRYDKNTNSLIKERLKGIQEPTIKRIEPEDNAMVVAIQILGESLQVGFSNGNVRHYSLEHLYCNNQTIFELPMEKQQNDDQAQFHKFYFEPNYYIAVKENCLYIRPYKCQKTDVIQIETPNKIIQCLYRIDLSIKKIEIQCLQETGKVFFHKSIGQNVFRESQLKYKDVSCLQACPKFKKFYYGFNYGELIWAYIKQKQQ